MHMYTYMCVYTCIFMHKYIYIYTYVCVCIFNPLQLIPNLSNVCDVLLDSSIPEYYVRSHTTETKQRWLTYCL